MARTRTPRPKAKLTPQQIEIRKIHIGATALNLIVKGDDEGYRAMLWAVARVRSSKDLDAQGRARVLDHLRQLGWQDTLPPRSNAQSRAAKPQVRMIYALWTALGEAGQLEMPTPTGLRNYVRQQSKPYHPHRTGYDAPEMLPPRVAQRVIEHLKHWCRRTDTPLPTD